MKRLTNRISNLSRSNNLTNNNVSDTKRRNTRAARYVVVCGMFFVFMLAATNYVPAQKQAYQPPATAELEQFRQDLDQVLEQAEQARDQLKQNPLFRELQVKNSKFERAPSSTQTHQEIQEMSYEELAVVHKAFTTHVPQWRGLPAMLNKIAKKLSKPTGANAVITPDSCSDAEILFPSYSDLAALNGFEIAAAAAFEVVPEPLNAPFVAAWLFAAETLSAGQYIRSIYDWCQDNADVAEIKAGISTVESRVSEVGNSIKENDDDNTGLILRSIDDGFTSANTTIINNNNAQTTALSTAITNASTSIINNSTSNTATLNTNINNTRTAITNNDNTNTTNIVNNDNANRSLIINNSNANLATLSNMMLRTQIEADLAEADNATFVAWYVMPTAAGGHFDFARAIVVETIAKLAGSSAPTANAFLAQSDAAKSAGDHKTAYRFLRKAYKAAVN